MGSINKGEIGQPIRINLNEDISLATPTLILEPELGIKKEITSGVTIPAVPVTIGTVTLNANEYIEYFTKVDDIDYVGRWRFKAKLDFSSTDVRQTDYQRFTVLA